MGISGILSLNSSLISDSSLTSEALPSNFNYLTLSELLFISSTQRDHVLSLGFPLLFYGVGCIFRPRIRIIIATLFGFFLKWIVILCYWFPMSENSSSLNFVQLSSG